jgi:hypothetical protein
MRMLRFKILLYVNEKFTKHRSGKIGKRKTRKISFACTLHLTLRKVVHLDYSNWVHTKGCTKLHKVHLVCRTLDQIMLWVVFQFVCQTVTFNFNNYLQFMTFKKKIDTLKENINFRLMLQYNPLNSILNWLLFSLIDFIILLSLKLLSRYTSTEFWMTFSEYIDRFLFNKKKKKKRKKKRDLLLRDFAIFWTSMPRKAYSTRPLVARDI